MDAACLPAPLRDGMARIGWEVVPEVLRQKAARWEGSTPEEADRAWQQATPQEAAMLEGDLAILAVAFRNGRLP